MQFLSVGFDVLRVPYFCALSACAPPGGGPHTSRRPLTPLATLAAALSPPDASRSRALGRFLARLLYVRELFTARAASLPAPPHRPDHTLCASLASLDRPDPSARVQSELAVRDWLGHDTPAPVVLCVPVHVWMDSTLARSSCS